MNRRQIFTFAIVLICAFNGISAQNAPTDTVQGDKPHEFTLKGEVLARGEWRDGALPAENSNEAKFVLERTRLTFNYKQKHLEMQLMPQHSGVWGTNGGGAFSLIDAWVKLDYKGAFAQVGRQRLSYDDERVIGLNDWSMTSAYHDALKLGYERGAHKAHVVLAYNQNNNNMNGGTDYVNGAQVYKTMQLLWYHWDIVPQFGASALFLNTGIQSSFDEEETKHEVYNQQLFGLYAKYHPKDITVDASFYWQRGKNEYSAPISAWMGSIEGNWDITNQWRANLGYFHLSGDKQYYVIQPGAFGLIRFTKSHAFNLLFASHHQFYGAMDFFYLKAFYGGYSPGLQDLHTGVQFKPNDKFTFGAQYHWLATSIKVEDLDRTIGHELELSASWNIVKDVKLSAGYSYMSGTDTMDVLKRTDDQDRLHWGWLMLSVSPRFFNIKW